MRVQVEMNTSMMNRFNCFLFLDHAMLSYPHALTTIQILHDKYTYHCNK